MGENCANEFMAPSPTPPSVTALVAAYLHRVDQELPGRLTGFYAVGSLALGDYRPGQSDIDFVAVTDSALASTELDTLRKIHARLGRIRPWPKMDGVYVTWKDLRAAPAGLSAPYCLNGRFFSTGAFAANPVTWATLRRHPFAFRGPAAPEVWHDDGSLRDWCRQNLEDYWMHWVRAARTQAIRRVFTLSRRARVWGVLGVTRLHATIRTGDIFSKTAAGAYASHAFSEQWAAVIEDALTGRLGGAAFFRLDTFRRRREALAYMEFVINDALLV